MLHELLFALTGTAGAVFTENKSGELEVVKDLPFLHPSETEQLKQICKLGSIYKRCMRFVEHYSVDLSPVETFANVELNQISKRNGIYIQSFAVGLDEILQPYREILVNLEREILRDPNVPLSYVQNSLESYHFLFPSLAEIIDNIEIKKIHGCQILDLLHEYSCCGIPNIKFALERILRVCHSALYKQMSAWVLHGILIDDYNEFFISNQPMKSQAEDTPTSEATQSQPQSDVIIRGITGRELDRIRSEDSKADKDDISTAFLVPEMLPGYLPSRLADKILFIGQSVKMSKDTRKFNTKIFVNKDDILQGREHEFLKAFHKLEKQPKFSLISLENEIDNIKNCVSEQLWKLVVEEGELVKHLKSVKEIYLLGRGELFQTFIDRAKAILKGPPSSALSYDLHSAFGRSLREILLESDDYKAFSMSLEFKENGNERNKQGDELTGWDSIFVKYEAPWPLHLLFTHTIIKRYNVLFRFLFEVKRTQLDLQSLWALQMVRKRSKGNKGLAAANISPTKMTAWSLRRQMAFLIDNLQYYLQVDVLEIQFSELVQKINETRDFEGIQLAHECFLTKLLAQSFITMKPVYNTLGEILKLCRMFCELVSLFHESWSEKEQSRTEEIGRMFDQHSSLLFKILSSVRSHQVSPHLAQLLLRIDFNKFFTDTKAQSLF